MPAVSYSAAAEDLLAALLLGKSRGVTYIDIGCLWPIDDSNTYLFYERGGHGLAVDPNPTVSEDWAAKRPRDVFVNCGVGSSSGELTYHSFVNPLFNTLSERRAAAVALGAERNSGRRLVGTDSVPVFTLDEVLDSSGFGAECASGVDLMSIDVEGLEDEVLDGYSFRICRPRVVVFETLHSAPQLAAIGELPIARRLHDEGYELVAATGHDAFFRDAETQPAA